MSRKSAFFFDELSLWHSAGLHALTLPVGGWVQPPAAAGHAESPETKRRLKSLLDVSGLTRHLQVRSAVAATDEDLLRVHTPDYLQRFKAMSDAGGGELGPNAPIGPGSYEIARLSAGLAMAAVDAVLSGDVDNAYSLSRPPGHHCLADSAMGFCFLVVIMVSGSMNLTEIVMSQAKGMAADRGLTFLSWNWLPLLPIFLVYLISGVAETNRHPFDVVEGEAEIVAGHMVEYSGMGFAIFFLAEYASMWLVSILAVLMFLGGWLPPIDSALFNWIPGWIWLGIKTFVVVSMFIWIRATFPRFRYDQIMRLGWKIFIPVTLIWLLLVGGLMQTSWNIWK